MISQWRTTLLPSHSYIDYINCWHGCNSPAEISEKQIKICRIYDNQERQLQKAINVHQLHERVVSSK